MSALLAEKSWKNELPQVRGEYLFDEPLAPLTTIKVGGNADVMFKPADMDDLIFFMQNKPSNLPVMVLGEGSNALISDAGIEGVVICLGKGTDDVQVNGTEIYAQAGATSGKVARSARAEDLTGAEFLCGIPGGIGGALKMNAGAYGQETVQILKSVEVITSEGEYLTKTPDEIGFSYRKSGLPKGWVYAAATFSLEKGDKEEIRGAMRKINKDRSTSQPLNMASSGSWFKNHVLEDGSKKNAWRIVDEAGCRGLQVGGAQVSEKHSNFFVNVGGATANDFIQLTGEVKVQVKEKLGIDLIQEVRVIGKGFEND